MVSLTHTRTLLLLLSLTPAIKQQNTLINRYFTWISLDHVCYSDNCFSGTDKPECVRHMTIDDPTRYYANSYSSFGGIKCDRDLAEGWYKFLNRRMATGAGYSFGYCDTKYQGWLIGEHPSVGDGIVSRYVCFYYSSNNCRYSVYIKVRNCGSFYVYKLKPTPNCNSRYCTSSN